MAAIYSLDFHPTGAVKLICRAHVLTLLLMLGCSWQKSNQNESLQAEVVSLQKTVEELKPGLGEIMGVILDHHAKLYYSGANENWALAGYERDELKEGLDRTTELYEHFKEVPGSLKDLRHITDPSMQEIISASRCLMQPMSFGGKA